MSEEERVNMAKVAQSTYEESNGSDENRTWKGQDQ